ncbi:MAG: M48 family metalloprotease [Pseudomonas sp.]|uniref:M48 family metalloprotease n=1 Tax=Pseudomonas sp. TaxID=306 RepID=UPI003BB76165
MQLETYNRAFYFSLCSPDEISKIENPESAEDYLLKLRANATVEHVRIHRVFLAKMRQQGGSWSFTNSFSCEPFENFKCLLSHEDYEAAKNIAAGFVFCNKPNGSIIKTDFGSIINISLSLRYFLYFMNLAFLKFDDFEVPGDVKGAAIKIALRTMLQSEALDFELDPRGIIPPSIAAELNFHTDRQLEFVIAHEYSHFFLGHLNEKNIIEDPLLEYLGSGKFAQKIFSYAQQDEFAADVDAIIRPTHTPNTRSDMLNRALFFFVYLDIFQDVKDQISPSFERFRTHPAPMDRFENLLHHFKDKITLDQSNIENLLKWRSGIKESLMEDVAVNVESYEFYGSIYLGSWRGKKLIDRVDY